MCLSPRKEGRKVVIIIIICTKEDNKTRNLRVNKREMISAAMIQYKNGIITKGETRRRSRRETKTCANKSQKGKVKIETAFLWMGG